MFGVPTCDHCVQWGKADSLSYVAELLNIEPSTRTGAGPMLHGCWAHVTECGYRAHFLFRIHSNTVTYDRYRGANVVVTHFTHGREEMKPTLGKNTVGVLTAASRNAHPTLPPHGS